MVAFPNTIDDSDDEMPGGLRAMLDSIAGKPAGDIEKPCAPSVDSQNQTVSVYFLNIIHHTHARAFQTFKDN